MRIARHGKIRKSLGLCQAGLGYCGACSRQFLNSVFHVQARSNGDLVVSAPGRMQLRPSRTDQIDQAFFDVHMNIFKLYRPLELATLYLITYLLKALDNCCHFSLSQYTHMSEHTCVSD